MEEARLRELLEEYYRARVDGQEELGEIMLRNFFFPIPMEKWQGKEYQSVIKNIQAIMANEVRKNPQNRWIKTCYDWSQHMGWRPFRYNPSYNPRYLGYAHRG
jgi:hypothetical protein